MASAEPREILRRRRLPTSGTAAVTGATSGIGRAFAERFAAAGLNLIITGRREGLLNQAAEELRRRYAVDVEAVVGDLTNPAVLKQLESILRGTEGLSYLVNNAGYGRGRLFYEDSREAQSDLLAIHTLVPLRLSHAALEIMRPRSRGVIVMVSSLASFTPIPRGSVYAAAKAFMRVFGEGLHMENLDAGITVQVLVPGFTRSDFHREGFDDLPKGGRFSLISWQTSDAVVDISLKRLGKGVICIPGFRNRLLRRIAALTPRRLLYSMVRQGRGALSGPGD